MKLYTYFLQLSIFTLTESDYFKGPGFLNRQLEESGGDHYLNGKSNWDQVALTNTPILTHVFKFPFQSLFLLSFEIY